MGRSLTGVALAFAAAGMTSAGAQDVAIRTPELAASAAAPGESVLLLGQLANRMTVPVAIGAEGPWHFVVDTGAERTVVSRELAARLGLAPGPQVRVMAMNGSSVVPSVLVPALSVSTVARHAITAPALEAGDLGAAGMVGIDALQDHAVLIDFDREQMTLRPSRKRRRAPVGRDDVVVTARSLYGQLIVTDAHWRGKRIAVVVDTGTPVSVGNSALLRLMKGARAEGPMTLISATGAAMRTDLIGVDGLQVGGVGFANVRLAIADAAPFRRFGLSDTPALMMGMDLLRLFRTVQIDFANREIRFTMPRGALVGDARVSGV